MHLEIKTIPHLQQRYDTCGDYFKSGKVWKFRISKMSDPNFEFLVAIHELVEWWWAQRNKISNLRIDTFDKQFEMIRQTFFPASTAEPGDHPDCPVYYGHQLGCAIERTLAAMLGINWQEYEEDFDNLPTWISQKK